MSMLNVSKVTLSSLFSCFTRPSVFLHSITEIVLGTFKKHPLITHTGVAVGVLAYVSLETYKHHTTTDKVVERLVNSVRWSNESVELKEQIREFVSANWSRFRLSDSNQNISQLLINKLCKIVEEYPNLSFDLKRKFVKQIIVNFDFFVNLNELIGKLINHSDRLTVLEMEEIDQVINAGWDRLGLPKSCDNANNRKYLSNKLYKVIYEHSDQPVSLRKEIADNIVTNFTLFMSLSLTRVEQDLRDDFEFRNLFDICGDVHIQKVEILGDETHNGGSNPLCIAISLSGRQKIIYKPRSVVTERLICGTQDSLFQRLGLSVYLVYPKGGIPEIFEEKIEGVMSPLQREDINTLLIPKIGQDYGYCEYLENREEENLFNSIEELQALYIEFGKIEKVAKAIGLGDLHADNIIMVGKRPCLIDTEVVSLPPIEGVYETQLFSDARAGALAHTETSKNRIWLSSALIKSEFMAANTTFSEEELQGLLYDYGMTGTVLQSSPELLQLIQKVSTQDHPEITTFNVKDIKRTELALKSHNNRIVLVHSLSVSEFIREDIKTAKDKFLNALKQGLEEWQFSFNQDQEIAILAKFEEDLKKNDIPVFHHNASQGKIYYGTIVIGRSRNPSGL